MNWIPWLLVRCITLWIKLSNPQLSPLTSSHGEEVFLHQTPSFQHIVGRSVYGFPSNAEQEMALSFIAGVTC